MHFLETPIEYLKGVGPMRAELLKKELKIFNFSDLLCYYPFRYIDRSVIHKVAELNTGMPYIQLQGKIIRFEEKGQKRAKRLIAYFQDETGIIELIWFKGIRWIKKGIKINVPLSWSLQHRQVVIKSFIDWCLKILAPMYASLFLINIACHVVTNK